MDGTVIPGSQTYLTQVTLRDIFAGQAMQQVMILRGPVVFNTILSELSYDIADAMIAERNKR